MACTSNTSLASLQAALARDHYAVVPATTMFELLSVLPEHANGLWDLWDEAVPQLDESGAEVYPFKDTLTSYYDPTPQNWTRRRAAPRVTTAVLMAW